MRTERVRTTDGVREAAWIDAVVVSERVWTDASLGSSFRVILTANVALAIPSNGASGQRVVYRVEQDAVGSRTLTLDSGWTTVGSISLTATAGAVTYFEATCVNPDAVTWAIQQTPQPSAVVPAIDSWPVGSVFMGSVATNPNTLLGGGSWSSLGSGNVTIGAGTMSVYAWERTA